MTSSSSVACLLLLWSVSVCAGIHIEVMPPDLRDGLGGTHDGVRLERRSRDERTSQGVVNKIAVHLFGGKPHDHGLCYTEVLDDLPELCKNMGDRHFIVIGLRSMWCDESTTSTKRSPTKRSVPRWCVGADSVDYEACIEGVDPLIRNHAKTHGLSMCAWKSTDRSIDRISEKLSGRIQQQIELLASHFAVTDARIAEVNLTVGRVVSSFDEMTRDTAAMVESARDVVTATIDDLTDHVRQVERNISQAIQNVRSVSDQVMDAVAVYCAQALNNVRVTFERASIAWKTAMVTATVVVFALPVVIACPLARLVGIPWRFIVPGVVVSGSGAAYFALAWRH